MNEALSALDRLKQRLASQRPSKLSGVPTAELSEMWVKADDTSGEVHEGVTKGEIHQELERRN